VLQVQRRKVNSRASRQITLGHLVLVFIRLFLVVIKTETTSQNDSR
jgi:hypothetical protein